MRGVTSVSSLASSRAQTVRPACFSMTSHDRCVMDAIGWDHRAFFASLDFPAHELDEVALSQQELARIGENVLFRLLAQAGRLQKGPI